MNWVRRKLDGAVNAFASAFGAGVGIAIVLALLNYFTNGMVAKEIAGADTSLFVIAGAAFVGAWLAR